MIIQDNYQKVNTFFEKKLSSFFNNLLRRINASPQ